MSAAPGSAEPLDEAAALFTRFERDLRDRGTETTRQHDDYTRIRVLHVTWHKDYRPRLAAELGDHPALDAVDDRLAAIRQLVGTRISVERLRSDLRAVARAVDNDLLPAYEASRWSGSAVREPAAGPTATVDAHIEQRLETLRPELARSYRQAKIDLGQSDRQSYMGPAGELREVLRGAVHALAPDDDAIKEETWYRGHQDRPTQAERIRYALKDRRDPKSALDAAELVDEKVAALGRTLYARGSKSLHAGAEQEEVARIAQYVEAVLNDLLP